MKDNVMLRQTLVTIYITIAILALCIGCSENAIQPQSTAVPESTYFVTEAQAKEIAQTTVNTQVSADGWSNSSKVTTIFPLYISGIEGVSYWECKVETNGSPSGYVVVTANKADILVPELSKTGITITEQFQQKTGSSDILVHRYDWGRSAAFSTGGFGLGKRHSGPLATFGFDDDFNSAGLRKTVVDTADSTLAGSFDEFEGKYAALAEATRCIPLYPKDSIDVYYNDLVSGDSSTNGLGKILADREDRAELKNYYSTPSGAPWHTVQWYQFEKDNGYAIGCGAVAWGIVYAYWDAFKGKSKLFGEAINTYNYSAYYQVAEPSIKGAIESIAKNIYTFDVTGDQGLTLPTLMELGINYARNCGYTASIVKDNGTENSKFEGAKNYLNEDKPLILLIHADGIGIVNHYVVIEAARKTQTKYLLKWHDRNVYYKVNYGWKFTNKEICVRDWGQNTSNVFTSTSMYRITIF